MDKKLIIEYLTELDEGEQYSLKELWESYGNCTLQLNDEVSGGYLCLKRLETDEEFLKRQEKEKKDKEFRLKNKLETYLKFQAELKKEGLI